MLKNSAFWILNFTTEICNISLVLKNNVFVRITVLEQNKIYEFNLIKYNVKFYTKPILLFLDEILMLRILHQLCKQLFTGFRRVGTFYQFPCSHTLFPWFSRSEVCAFVWGMFVRGLRIETFVRVLRSSRVLF